MFEKLTDFSFQRSRKQAIGFYLFWLIAGSIITAIVMDIYIRVTGNAPMPGARDIGGALRALEAVGKTVVPIILLIFSLILTGLVVKAKNAYNPAGLICMLLAAAFSFVGLIFSLIPVAYLTTRPKNLDLKLQ